MPDTLFANRTIYEDDELRTLLLANGHATMKEVSDYIQAGYEGRNYVFESSSHRLSMCDNIFDSCMLVSGKKDDQGYIPENVIFNDVAYFLYKLSHNTYVDDPDENGRRKLLRDSFFERSKLGYFKVANEADYKVPIKEIENIIEHSVFKEAYSRMNRMPENDDKMQADIQKAFGEMRTFLQGAPGDEIDLSVNGLIKTGQYPAPVYEANSSSKEDSSFPKIYQPERRTERVFLSSSDAYLSYSYRRLLTSIFFISRFFFFTILFR